MAITFSVVSGTNGLQWSNDGGVTNFPLVDKVHDINIAARPSIKASTADVTLVAKNSGSIYLANKAGSNHVFTLPAANTKAGLLYTFLALNTSFELRIVPQSADTLKGIRDTSGDTLTLIAGRGIKNVTVFEVGDMVTLVSDGVNSWYPLAQVGNWTGI